MNEKLMKIQKMVNPEIQREKLVVLISGEGTSGNRRAGAGAGGDHRIHSKRAGRIRAGRKRDGKFHRKSSKRAG